jgi:hypothetical protein
MGGVAKRRVVSLDDRRVGNWLRLLHFLPTLLRFFSYYDIMVTKGNTNERRESIVQLLPEFGLARASSWAARF